MGNTVAICGSIDRLENGIKDYLPLNPGYDFFTVVFKLPDIKPTVADQRPVKNLKLTSIA